MLNITVLYLSHEMYSTYLTTTCLTEELHHLGCKQADPPAASCFSPGPSLTGGPCGPLRARIVQPGRQVAEAPPNIPLFKRPWTSVGGGLGGVDRRTSDVAQRLTSNHRGGASVNRPAHRVLHAASFIIKESSSSPRSAEDTALCGVDLAVTFHPRRLTDGEREGRTAGG
ncbi:unnamed protein product [Lota lota]